MKNIPVKVNNIDSLDADEFNPNQNELENAVSTTGQTLAEANEFQLPEAMARYAATGGVFYEDSGAADAYILTKLGSFIVPAIYLDGALAVFKIGNDSTGASTINYAGIGVKNLTLPDGTDISTQMVAGEYAATRYNLADDRVELVSVSAAGGSEFLVASFDLGDLNSATTLHISDGPIQHGGITGSFVLTPPDDLLEGYLEVELTIDGTGGYTVDVETGVVVLLGQIVTTANTINVLRYSKLNTNTYLQIAQAS